MRVVGRVNAVLNGNIDLAILSVSGVQLCAKVGKVGQLLQLLNELLPLGSS